MKGHLQIPKEPQIKTLFIHLLDGGYMNDKCEQRISRQI